MVSDDSKDDDSLDAPSGNQGETTVNELPGRVKRWAAVSMLAFGSFIFISTEFLSIGLLSEISSFYKVSPGSAGLMTTMTGIAAAVSAPVLTRYMGRLDRKSAILVFTALLFVSNIVMAFAPTFWIALAGRLILGIGLGGFWAFSVPFGVNIVNDAQKKRATTLITAGIAGGSVAGVPIGTFLGVHFGWQNAYLFMAGLSGAILIAQALALPSLKSNDTIRFASMFKIIAEASVRKRLLSTLTFATAHFAAYTYFELILTEQADLGQESLPSMLLLYGITGLAGTFLAEILVRTFGAKNTFRIATAVLLLAVGLMPTASAHFSVAVSLTLLWGLSYGVMPVAINIWLYEANERDYIVSTASNSSLYQVAVAIGSLTGGVIFNVGGTAPVIIFSVSVAIACLMVSFIKSPR